MANTNKAAAMYLARYGWQLVDGQRILKARARAKTEHAWDLLNELYLAWDDQRWTCDARAIAVLGKVHP